MFDGCDGFLFLALLSPNRNIQNYNKKIPIFKKKHPVVFHAPFLPQKCPPKHSLGRTVFVYKQEMRPSLLSLILK